MEMSLVHLIIPTVPLSTSPPLKLVSSLSRGWVVLSPLSSCLIGACLKRDLPTSFPASFNEVLRRFSSSPTSIPLSMRTPHSVACELATVRGMWISLLQRR